MQFMVFTVPIIGGESEIEEMNSFIRSHRVVDVTKSQCACGASQYWSFCLTFIENMTATPSTRQPAISKSDKKEKIDYREVLSPETFKIFADMRKARKALAERESVPAYAIFLDSELAELAQMPSLSMESLQNAKGVGEQRIKKYAADFMRFYQEESNGTGVDENHDKATQPENVPALPTEQQGALPF